MPENHLSFQFKSIDILEFSFIHPKNVFPKDAKFRFETHIEQKVNLEKENILVICSFNIHCENTNETVGRAVIGCVYSIENIRQFVNEKDVFQLPEQFVIMFNSLSISTCRGVLFTLFRGTPLHSVILPVIDTKVLNQKKPLQKNIK